MVVDLSIGEEREFIFRHTGVSQACADNDKKYYYDIMTEVAGCHDICVLYYTVPFNESL